MEDLESQNLDGYLEATVLSTWSVGDPEPMPSAAFEIFNSVLWTFSKRFEYQCVVLLHDLINVTIGADRDSG